MNQPGAPTTTIGGLINRVIAALQNRSDVNENASNPEMRPSRWLRDALREITADNVFEELRQPNPPVVTIGPGLGVTLNGFASSYAYKVSSFVNPADDFTLTEDPVIFLNTTFTGPATPTNQIAYPMDYLTPKAIAPLLNVPGGIPFKYTRFGDQLWFGSAPGQRFQVYLPYQVRHPFNDDNLLVSPAYVPPDWHDIIAYAAAQRGAVALRWNEQADFLHKLLYGDPDTMIKDGVMGRPGLIKAKVLQQERDRRVSTIQISPMVSRY